jgi:predicted ferric reductase
MPPLRRHAGPASIAAVSGAFAVLWCVVGPGDGGWGSFVAQFAGAEAVLLMSTAIVLISVLPVVEVWFDGIDRAAIWHRRLSIVAMVLLVPHIMFSSADPHRGMPAGTAYPPGGRGGSGTGWGGTLAQVGIWGLAALVVWAILPRWRALVPWWHVPLRRAGTAVAKVPGIREIVVVIRRLLGDYERWRSLHRLTGLFLAAGFVHGLLDATMFGSALLRWTYVAVGGIGLGQFAMLFLEGKNGWRRHPFTLSGAPRDGVLHFTIKALGDDTASLQNEVQPGMPAVVGGPHGRFDRSRGTSRQVWIAGGIGVTPFLSWLRSLDRHPLPDQVDFFYSTFGPAPFATEITAIAEAHPNLRVHLQDSSADGFLTADAVLAAVSLDDRRELSVFLCGPGPMVNAFVRRFRTAGVRSRNIHREHFDWR